MTDDTEKKPTGANIMDSLSKLITKSHTKKAQELWFHYSGHGGFTQDLNGDESDGRDETIIPLDYKTKGVIVDDQLHDYVKYVNKNCRMICLFDCCHSGTILDLKWNYEGKLKNRLENARSDITSEIIMISGCKDCQTSADAYIKGNWAGAMTTSFLNCINNSDTCDKLLDNMRFYLKKNKYTQYPMISCSRELSDKDKFPK